MDTEAARRRMVDRQIRARGIRDPRVLAAMQEVPREAFLPREMADDAYEDRPLPIAAGQTISQPYVVAVMVEALKLAPGARVLEIGTGSGYAAAVLAKVAAEVFTVERIEELATGAGDRLADLGYANVRVRHGDGTLGWLDHAPYDAIVVAAGGPEPPRALLDQLAIGGRLVMPVGAGRGQELVRITRAGEAEYHREDLGGVVFVPLIGEQGWPLVTPAPAVRAGGVAKLVAECADPIQRIDDASLDSLFDRIGDARVVLLGEATHGTSEFYRMRAHITQELILRRGFRAVAVEADWPDAAAIDRYVRGAPPSPRPWTPFARFPAWMWRNVESQQLVEWMRAYNAETHGDAGFYGLDLYSMYTSAYEVVRYLERIDHAAAALARERYGRITPWEQDPAAYGKAALLDRLKSAEPEVIAMLRDLLAKRLEYAVSDGDAFFDAAMNARVVAGAERYYRAMYYGSVESWNLRDQHMFDTIERILSHRGDGAKLIVWEHNSHIGNAAATEMSVRGEHNVGQLCRAAFGDAVYAIGFGTDHGTVAAAHAWEEPMEIMRVRAARADSYERVCHDASLPAFFLALRDPMRDALRDELSEPRLERAIGVVYRPDTELQSHYFQAVLPLQFDEYIWFDATEAVAALPLPEEGAAPGAHPLLP